MKKTECKYCYGKGYYTVYEQTAVSSDFIGDKRYLSKPKIVKHPCPRCKSKIEPKLGVKLNLIRRVRSKSLQTRAKTNVVVYNTSMGKSSDAWHFRHRTKLRTDALEALGGKCIRCGFSDRRALQIDHINGGGVKELKENRPYKYLMRVIEMKDSGRYQILCANCNWIKRFELRENSGYKQNFPLKARSYKRK